MIHHMFVLRDETDPSRLTLLRRQQRLAKKDRNEKNSLRMDTVYRLSLGQYVCYTHYNSCCKIAFCNWTFSDKIGICPEKHFWDKATGHLVGFGTHKNLAHNDQMPRLHLTGCVTSIYRCTPLVSVQELVYLSPS